MNKQSGQLLLEILIAVVAIVAIAGLGAQLILVGERSNKITGDKDTALKLVEETFEAVRGIATENWQFIYKPPDGTGDPVNDKGETKLYYLAQPSDKWVLTATSQIVTINGINYTRSLYIDNVNRDASKNIVLTGGTDDPSTQKIVISVNWPGVAGITGSEYITRWRGKGCVQTDWTTQSGDISACGTANYESIQNLSIGTDLKVVNTPITYVNNTSSTGNNTTSGFFSLPSGWTAGDVAVFWWYTYDNTKTFTCVAFCDIIEKQQASASGYGRIYIGYRILQSGDTTFAWTSSSVNNSTVIWGTSVFSGVATSGDPFEAQSGVPVTFDNANDPNPPAVNAVSDGAFVIPIFGKRNDYTFILPPTSYVIAGSDSSTSGSDASAGVAYRQVLTPGIEDPDAWILSGGTGGDDGYVWTGALKPKADMNDPAYNSIIWKGTLPAGNVRFRIAASDDPLGPGGSWDDFDFIGSNGTTCGSAFWYEPSGPDTPMELGCFVELNNKRYFMYKVQLCSDDCVFGGAQTPTVTDVIVNWSP